MMRTTKHRHQPPPTQRVRKGAHDAPSPLPTDETLWAVTFTRTVTTFVESPDPQQAIMYAEHRVEKEHRHRLNKITIREVKRAERAP